jgi:PIN domain nuclease of toxin-antitoxin system
MNLLLDTNALIWVASGRNRSLGKAARRVVEDSDVVYFSAVSLVELRMKAMIGKLKLQPDVVKDAISSGIVPLGLEVPHADTISDFPSLVRHDPFDRMLLAQARAEKLWFLTGDELLLRLNLPFVVDARE